MCDIPEKPLESPDASAPSDHAAAPEEPQRRWSVVLLAIASAVVFLSFVLIDPALEWLNPRPRPLARFASPPPQEVIAHRGIAAVTAAWFFMLGASFGSFMHCVEYRLPRGMSIVARGSSCPSCGAKIRLWHNVPLFGWLILRGRCAACGWRIPARYAAAELIFGLAFLLLMTFELAGGGLNLPLRDMPSRFGMQWNLWTPNLELITIYGYHAALLTLLLTFAIFACDRHPVPPSLILLGVLIGIGLPLAFPHVHPLPWHGEPVVGRTLAAQVHVAITLVAGVSAAVAIGLAMVRRTAGNLRQGDGQSSVVSLALVGLSLGWQAALGVALLATAIRWLAAITPARRWPLAVWIAAATLVHLLGWRWLHSHPLWPIHYGSWLSIAITVIGIALLSVLLDRYEQGGEAAGISEHSNGAPRCAGTTSDEGTNHEGMTNS
jgi:leader peptidase (prepilin peptidase) / N-methyltransferase